MENGDVVCRVFKGMAQNALRHPLLFYSAQ
jgi:hypothetical protein